jgi:MFS transporter, DHA3 family, macrolide efflux protein
MLLGGIVLGLALGLLNGGRLDHISLVRLRWPALIFLAVLLRYGAEALIIRNVDPAVALRGPLLVGASVILLAGLWANLTAAGFTPQDASPAIHTILPATLDSNFLLHLGPFADILPIPVPLLANVASIGDVLIAFGLAFFLFAIVQREPEPEPPASADANMGRPLLRPTLGLAGAARLSSAGQLGIGPPAGTGLIPGLSEASRLDRPILLGSSGISMSAPTALTLPPSGAPRTLADRARQNPYGRLALNGPFATLWTGGLFSLFGDRVNQVVLAVFILGRTHSVIATSFVFFAATVPNLLFGSLAGTFVDRTNQKRVLVASDFLRAAIVFLLPIAAVANVILVYPMVFLITSVSIFFRPAREAVIPRIVPADQLLSANSATWMAETLADIIGYGLAGLLLLALGTNFELAFWFDAATYVVSGLLITTIAIPAVVRAAGSVDRTFRGDFMEGWRFLRDDVVLFANTLQAVAGQMAIGALLGLSAIYANTVLRGNLPGVTTYAFLEDAIGVGNLIGGVVVGIVGVRIGKGRLVIAGYAVAGACIALYSRTDILPLALALMVGMGIANLIFVIPSQTLFQQRVPREMMARVVSIRFSLVLGTMTLATAASGLLASVFGVANVIGAFGVVACLAGLAGLLVPAVRDA